VDGQPVAAQLYFTHGQTVFQYYSGYAEEWGWYGVLTVLFQHVVRRAIERNFRSIDFMLEATPYKQRWGDGYRPVQYNILANPQPRSQLALLGYVAGSRLRDLGRSWTTVGC
jgi:CelD/BcsL family acetyltransferase involved in cellulose biosynthesis